jgi:hypothetical protein
MSPSEQDAKTQSIYVTGYRDGRLDNVNDMIHMLNYNTCFDHIENQTCDHVQCWGFQDLKRKLEKNKIEGKYK